MLGPAAVAALVAGCQPTDPPTAQPWVSLVNPDSDGAFERCVGFLAFVGLEPSQAHRRGLGVESGLDRERIDAATSDPMAAYALSRYQGSFNRKVYPRDAPEEDAFFDAETERCARVLTSTT